MGSFYYSNDENQAQKLENEEFNLDFNSNDFDAEKDEENIASKKEVLTALNELFARKPNICANLANYAKYHIEKFTGNMQIDGTYADDIVEIVFEKILLCIRKWYKDRVKTIDDLIYLAILSEIRNLVKKSKKNNHLQDNLNDKENKNRRKSNPKPIVIPLYGTDRNGKLKENSIADEENVKPFSEDDIYADDVTGFEEYIAMIEKELEAIGDKDNGILSYFVFQERLKGNRSNIKTAKDLGVEVNEVENAVKLLKRTVLNKTHSQINR
jgi:hypothetical protein